MSVAKAKMQILTQTKMLPAFPNTLPNAAAQASEPSPSVGTPETKRVIAVTVHMTTVSRKTSSMPQQPCSAGESVCAAAWIIALLPSPASFEKTPRATP